MRQFARFKKAAVAFLVCAAAVTAGNRPTFTILTTFPAGIYAGYPPVQGTDGNYYGRTGGSTSQDGTIFKMTPQGAVTTIYTFCSQPKCADGSFPTGGLLLGTDGNFYGTTKDGGAYGFGTVYKITPAGVLTTLYSFANANDGTHPCAPLIQANSGDFYGTTMTGGARGFGGTIFKMTAAGALTALYNFPGVHSAILCAALLQSASGSFYGTNVQDTGGLNLGSIYELSLAGTFKTAHNFSGTDGANPQDALVETADGSFYGTTAYGGANNYGTVFKFASDGTLTTLYSFGNSRDGSYPYAPLVYASNGKFYGTATAGGGQSGNGTIFEITSTGTLTRLYSFSESDGQPILGLAQGTDGLLYGTSGNSVYSLSAGLPPLIKPVPLSGAVGSAVMILGTNLTGSTSVTFNGIAAAFTVVSPTEIMTTVPADAATGKIQVATPGGTLSNVGRFIVTK